MKSTLYRPKKKKRKVKHGFLGRMQTKSGRNVITRRRRKGRSSLAV
ncbi:MAG: 50S ribosomal protein L34 [Candidatus Levybacteria bacterium]|nr:50S ribosomal protein L34 [Candidatus Levybacteria bacterium]